MHKSYTCITRACSWEVFVQWPLGKVANRQRSPLLNATLAKQFATISEHTNNISALSYSITIYYHVVLLFICNHWLACIVHTSLALRWIDRAFHHWQQLFQALPCLLRSLTNLTMVVHNNNISRNRLFEAVPKLSPPKIGNLGVLQSQGSYGKSHHWDCWKQLGQRQTTQTAKSENGKYSEK